MSARRAHDEEADAMTGSSSAAAVRSWLFVPGDSARKQAKAVGSKADALILDLEDSVAQAQLPVARAQVCDLLKSHGHRSRQLLWVRVNSPTSGILLDDLAAVLPGAPDGIVLPKISSASQIIEVSHYLAALEAREGIKPNSTRLLPIVTETAQALLTLSSYPRELAAAAPASSRVLGLTWGAEDLSAALGVSKKTDETGSLTLTLQLARALCVITASALEVQAVDGIHADFRDGKGLSLETERARQDGFTGKLAIHPDQVEVINAGFTPGAAEIERAQRILAAFAATPQTGVTSLDGQMIDRPHLLQAQRILALIAHRQDEVT